jgi:hypothetical protein
MTDAKVGFFVGAVPLLGAIAQIGTPLASSRGRMQSTMWCCTAGGVAQPVVLYNTLKRETTKMHRAFGNGNMEALPLVHLADLLVDGTS